MEKVDQLTGQVIALQSEISLLKGRLSKYENPKNSSNSSIPPSKDENRPARNQSLRKRSGKNPGGQAGHEGETLQMTATPDDFIDHSPDYCQACGNSLSGFPGQLEGRRQVVDIPDIQAVWTEHRQYSKQCSCGHTTVTAFPKPVKAPVQFGPGVEALVCYLHGRQYIPYARMQELVRDSYGISISQGSIDNMIKRFAGKAENAYGRIKEEVISSRVVGSDETGIKINGKKHWAWTWQDVKNTFISISPSRGIQAIKDQFTGNMAGTILCHDAWRAHLWVDCKGHQLCCAHLLRELNYLNELHNQPWSKQFKDLITKAINLKRQMDPQEYATINHPDRKEILLAFEKLLAQPPDEKHKELNSFYKRMLKYKNYIFPFLHYEDVPPDNNASERAIRNIKVKQKISGQFRSMKGAQDFAIIRSIIDTLNKRNLNIFQNLQLIANFDS